MINIRELRHWNTVEYNSKCYRVCAIGVKIKIGVIVNPAMYAGAFDVDASEIHPIPITEERLLRIGFKKLQRCEYRLDNFLYKMEEHSIKILDISETERVYEEVLYIHQLQNVYFQLYSRELIK